MRDTRTIHRIVIRIHHPDQFPVFLHDQTLHHEWQIVNLDSISSGLNILSAGTQDHRLATSTYKNTVVMIDRTQITRP